MDDKPKLKLVKKINNNNEINNFWACCPATREYLPEEIYSKAIPSPDGEDLSCPWWINSAQHGHCFWRYIRDKSDADGVMKELVQSELATLFGWSNTKTHFMLKQAMVELTDALKLHGALELLQDISADDLENIVVLDDCVSSDPVEPSE